MFTKLKTLLFVIVSLIIVSFFYVHCADTFDGIIESESPVEAIYLYGSEVYAQEIAPGEELSLAEISLAFDTFDRKNTGTLYVSLYVSDSLVESWVMDTAAIEDEVYLELGLSKVLKVNPGDTLRIEFYAEYEGENGIAVLSCEQSEDSFYREGISIANRGCCYKLICADTDLKPYVFVIATLLFLTIGFLLLRKTDEKLIMATIFVICGIIYMWVCPLGMAPDEGNHFYRAFEISDGKMVSEHIGAAGVGGNYLPAALTSYFDKTAELDWTEISKIEFSNTALYAPVSYLPQAIGIGIARIFTDNVSAIFYAGKWGNFIAAVFLCITALYIVPFGKKILFMIMLFPLTLQEMVSMSPDGFTIALSLLFIAYILRLTYDKKSITTRDMAIVAVLSVLISLCKIVYIALLLMILLIPAEKLGTKKKNILTKLGIIGVSAILNLIWLSISSGFLVEFQAGVDSGKQVIYVLTHLPEYYIIMIRTLIQNSAGYVQTMFGSVMGAANIGVSSVMWISFCILFLYEIVQNRECPIKPGKADRWILLLSFLGGTLLIFTSLYVQWTALESDMVSGLQGRYFTPIIALLAFFVVLSNKEKSLENGDMTIIEDKGSYIYFIVLVLNGIAVLDVMNYYF